MVESILFFMSTWILWEFNTLITEITLVNNKKILHYNEMPLQNKLIKSVYYIISVVSGDEGAINTVYTITYIYIAHSVLNVVLALCPLVTTIYTDFILILPDSFFLGFSFCLVYWWIGNMQIFSNNVSSLNLSIYVNCIAPIIELISKLLRAISLSLRMGTNFSAGHVLMVVLSVWTEILTLSKVYFWYLIAILIILPICLFIFFMELLFGCLQIYVFGLLSILYCIYDN